MRNDWGSGTHNRERDVSDGVADIICHMAV